MICLHVETSEDGFPVDQFLSGRIPAAPLAYLRQLLRSGKICQHKNVLSLTDRVVAGSLIELPESKRLQQLIDESQGREKLDILLETEQILVINKPSGLAVHSSRGHEQKNLTDLVKKHYRDLKAPFSVAPVQRLDLETSGPILFGKGKKSCSELGKLFLAGEVKKIYLALVSGQLLTPATLTSEIKTKGKLKKAQTSYRPLATNAQASLLEIELHSGRQHQIRRQFADQGHPLYGDRRYRGRELEGLTRLFLHCRRLAFRDPFTGQPLDIKAALPDDLEQLLAGLKLRPL